MPNLDKANSARLAKLLNKRYQFRNGRIMTLQQWIDSQSEIVLDVTDRMIDYNARRFNLLDGREQIAYLYRLENEKYYWANDLRVPKMVFDYLRSKQTSTQS